jgi:hypothetical protein
MYHLSIKNWLEHAHVPHRRDIALLMAHIAHDDRFWALLWTLVLLGMIVGLTLLIRALSQHQMQFEPYEPLFLFPIA